MKKFNLYELDREKMKDVKGAAEQRACGCSCYYADNGGSSIGANGSANFGVGENGAYSKKGYLKEFIVGVPKD